MMLRRRRVSEGNLFWFLELRGFETVSNGFFTMCHVCLSGELLWFDDLLHAHLQFGNILCGALLPSVMRRVLEGVLPMVRRLDLRGSNALLLSLVGV